MEFSTNKPIYRQIVDFCYREITEGNWDADGRIPSVKDLSVKLAVNNRTILNAYDEMQEAGVIYQKRGLGYFVSPDAKDRIISRKRDEFFREIVPEISRQMNILGITPGELARYLADQ